MASTVTVNTKRMNKEPMLGVAPYGNASVRKFNLLCVSGVPQNTDSAVALAADAVVALGILKAGTTVKNAWAVLKTASGEVTTADVGFEYVDGESGTPAADQDAWFDGLDLDGSAAQIAKTTPVSELTFPRDVYVTLKNLGNAQASGLDLDIFLLIEDGGQP